MVTFFGGILSDFVPSILLFPTGLILCGLTTILFPFGTNTTYFAFIWFLNGIGQGLALPTAMRLIKELSPKNVFASNWSFVLAAVNVAGVLNPLISTFVAKSFNWSMAIYLSGLITFCTGLTVFLLFNNKSDHKQKVIEHLNNQSKNNQTNGSLRLARLFVFPTLWLIVVNR